MPDKIKVEKVGTENSEEITPPEAPVETSVDISLLTDLKKQAVELGMLKEDAEKFDNEELLQVTVNSLRAVKESQATPAIIPSKEDSETEKKWLDKAERMRLNFESQPKVRVLIPIEGAETPGIVEKKMVDGKEVVTVKGGSVWSKTFNGYRVIIPKGVYTEVAEQIADNISKEYSQTQSAGDRWKLDRLDPTTGRTVREQLS